MAQPILDDELWQIIEPLIPPPKPRRTRYPGRKPLSNRAVLTGILFVLKTGIAWEDLPQELGWGSGMTCWRRLAAWQAAGVWDQVHRVLLDRLRQANQIDWSRAAVDSTSVRAVFGGTRPGLIPRIAAKQARSTMSRRMVKAFLWPRKSQRPTITT
jgi:transposase